MPEPPSPSRTPAEAPPTPEELEAILEDLEFFLNLDEVEVLPLEEGDGGENEGGWADE